VPASQFARFNIPENAGSGNVRQPERGALVAFDAVCPRAWCAVGYSSEAELIVCPCLGSEFNPATGAVEVGPASCGLTSFSVQEGGDGQLYVR